MRAGGDHQHVVRYAAVLDEDPLRACAKLLRGRLATSAEPVAHMMHGRLGRSLRAADALELGRRLHAPAQIEQGAVRRQPNAGSA